MLGYQSKADIREFAINPKDKESCKYWGDCKMIVLARVRAERLDQNHCPRTPFFFVSMCLPRYATLRPGTCFFLALSLC